MNLRLQGMIMRSLNKRFSPQVMTIEVIKDLDSIKVEELLQTYELTNLRQVKQVDGLKNC